MVYLGWNSLHSVDTAVVKFYAFFLVSVYPVIEARMIFMRI